MPDNRFTSPGVDNRFPSPGTDTRFPSPGTDTRFTAPGVDARFAEVIAATTWPSMGVLTETDTPAGGFVAGAYTSSEGTISSAVPTYYVNGNVEAGTYDLQPGDVVYASVLVTDSVGNTGTFITNTSRVPRDLTTFDSTLITWDATTVTFDEAA